ncbi:hypothetical protein [Nesterenkonia jeotgali]|nr:hypothetical protein [Nesterenkonia jeotgali]
MKINYGAREDVFGADDLTIAALERVIRRRLTESRGFFITAPNEDQDSPSVWMTLVVSPHAHVSFSYTDPSDYLKLSMTAEDAQLMLDEHGGFALDENDFLTEPG